METKTWKLKEWNSYYSDCEVEAPPMTKEEIADAIKYLRDNFYPIPEDCPRQECPKHRPACSLGICHIAVGMCGDF